MAFDLDGTIVRHGGLIGEDDRAALHRARERGVVVALASGRVLNSVRQVALDLGLDGPLIAANGAQIAFSCAPDAPTECVTIPETDVRAVLDAAVRVPGVNWQAYTEGRIHRRAVHEQFRVSYQTAPGLSFHLYEDNDSFWPFASSVFMLTVFGLDDAFEAVLSSLPDHLDTHASYQYNTDITLRGVSKGWALERVAASLGIPRADILAAGDNGNDVSMLRFAGVGVAMGNATPEAIAAADFVTLPCDQCGVAYAIRKYTDE